MMKLLSWFDASQAEAFGQSLAELYDSRCAVIDGQVERKKSVRHEKLIVELVLQARQFSATSSVNPYRKAKLANRFKWVLRDKGYDDSVIDPLIKEILLALSR